MCVAHFKSKEPESKRPRICLEEGRAATFGSVWADETKGRLALPGVKVASSSLQHGGPNSNPPRCSERAPRAVDRKRPVPSPRLGNRGGRRTESRSSLHRINVVDSQISPSPSNRCALPACFSSGPRTKGHGARPPEPAWAKMSQKWAKMSQNEPKWAQHEPK